MAAYKLMQFVSWLVCHQPDCLNHALAWVLGHLGWRVVPAWRRYMAKENIKDCLGVDEARAEEIARESVYRFGRMLIEVLKYPLITISGSWSASRDWKTWKRPMPKTRA